MVKSCPPLSITQGVPMRTLPFESITHDRLQSGRKPCYERCSEMTILQSKRMTSLISASKKGLIDKVREEIKRGADVDSQDEEKATPLYWACCRGNDRIAKLLISKGADINHRMRMGSTALHAACDRGYYNCAKVLLESGAEVNAQNVNQDSALHLAAFRGFLNVCTLLITFKADLFFVNIRGKIPIQEAVSSGHSNIEDLLDSFMSTSYPGWRKHMNNSNHHGNNHQFRDTNQFDNRDYRSLVKSAQSGPLGYDPPPYQIPCSDRRLQGEQFGLGANYSERTLIAQDGPASSIQNGTTNFTDNIKNKLETLETDLANERERRREAESKARSMAQEMFHLRERLERSISLEGYQDLARSHKQQTL